MINIEAEVNKHRNVKDRDELSKIIKEYKNLALQHAANLSLAGEYSKVALKLQEICDKLPAPKLIKYPAGTQGASSKTPTITNEERARISAEWKKKTSG